MYGSVREWWERLLRERYSRSQVKAYDTSEIVLHRFIKAIGLEEFFPDYLTYEVEIDITAVIQASLTAALAFVECKLRPIALQDIGQMLGYSKVVRPEHSLIVSPRGLSNAVERLLRTYQRFDVLDYGGKSRIRLATWSPQREEIIAESLLPPGEFF